MLNDNVKKVLENSMWDLATCLNGKPNVVPVAFKSVSESGDLLIGDVFLETTLKNVLENNGEIAISAYDASSLEGYQIQGRRSMRLKVRLLICLKSRFQLCLMGQQPQRVL